MNQCLVCGVELQPPARRGRPKTTCSPECAVLRKRQLRESSRQKATKRGCPPDKHGTSTGYTYYKCDCAACRKWAADYMADRREAAREATTPHPPSKGVTTMFTFTVVAAQVSMKKGAWRGLEAELDELEASDPAVRAAKQRLKELPDTAARYERHMAARRAVGKRAVPDEE